MGVNFPSCDDYKKIPEIYYKHLCGYYYKDMGRTYGMNEI